MPVTTALMNGLNNTAKIAMKDKINFNTTIEDLLQYAWLKNKKRWAHNNRLHKRFLLNWYKYIPFEIAITFISLGLARSLHERLYDSSILRKFVTVENIVEEE